MTIRTTLLVLLMIGCGGWLFAALSLRMLYRPRRPRPDAPTAELRDEPPAVVNLIANGWHLTPEAAPATLLDLANRRLLEIVQVSPEHEVVELRPRADLKGLALTAYEAQLLEHLRKVAVGNTVPATALTTGPEAASAAWWSRFRSSVVKDAQRRGLSRARYPMAVVGALATALLGLAFAIVLVIGTADKNSNDIAPWALFGSLGLVAVCFWLSAKFDRNAQRDTDAGLVAASHWLGVRDAYTEAGNYDVLPPAAVVLYERHLAYATAMGVATTCIQRLPLGAEDDRHAWSGFGGRWRQVEVRYPRHRCGWGTSTGRAVVTGFLWSLLLVVPVWLLSKLGGSLYDTVHDSITDLGGKDTAQSWLNDTSARWIALGVAAVVSAGLLALVWNAVRRGLLPLVRGVLDLGRSRSVQGRVVRVREFHRTQGDNVITDTYVAVDDGSTDDLVAWKVRNELAVHLDQGDDVLLEVTPHLGYVRTLRELVKAPAPLPPPSLEDLLPPAAPAPPPPPPMPAPWWGDQAG